MKVFPKGFAIWFRDLERWDPASFHGIDWHWPSRVMVPIGSILRMRKEKVDRNKYPFSTLQPITIHFDGSIERRDIDDNREYSMDLYFARPGDIVVAKIDLKNGAVGILPDWGNIVVTGHFAVYEPDRAKLLPEYFVRLIQADFLKAYLWRNKVGAEGRKEVKLDFFESIQIPLPPPKIQRAIIAYWQNAQHFIDRAEGTIKELVKRLNEHLYAQYRLSCAHDVIGTRFFVLGFKDLAQWDVKSGRSTIFRTHCQNFRPMGDFIEDATEVVRPFDEPEKEWPIYGVNNREGVFFNTYQKGSDFNAPYKRIRKDWFFHNPTRCNVGSLGIVPDVPEDAITSPEYQVWRLREKDSERLLPGYVALLIQTSFFLELVQFNRVGAVKQRMYYENLCEIRIPSLPESEQLRYSEERAKALEEIQKARTYLEQVKKEIEEMILGIRPVPH